MESKKSGRSRRNSKRKPSGRGGARPGAGRPRDVRVAGVNVALVSRWARAGVDRETILTALDLSEAALAAVRDLGDAFEQAHRRGVAMHAIDEAEAAARKVRRDART